MSGFNDADLVVAGASHYKFRCFWAYLALEIYYSLEDKPIPLIPLVSSECTLIWSRGFLAKLWKLGAKLRCLSSCTCLLPDLGIAAFGFALAVIGLWDRKSCSKPFRFVWFEPAVA